MLIGIVLMILDLALQVLDDVIMTRWKVLPREQCLGNPLLGLHIRVCLSLSDGCRYPKFYR